MRTAASACFTVGTDTVPPRAAGCLPSQARYAPTWAGSTCLRGSCRSASQPKNRPMAFRYARRVLGLWTVPAKKFTNSRTASGPAWASTRGTVGPRAWRSCSGGGVTGTRV